MWKLICVLLQTCALDSGAQRPDIFPNIYLLYPEPSCPLHWHVHPQSPPCVSACSLSTILVSPVSKFITPPSITSMSLPWDISHHASRFTPGHHPDSGARHHPRPLFTRNVFKRCGNRGRPPTQEAFLCPPYSRQLVSKNQKAQKDLGRSPSWHAFQPFTRPPW